MLNTPAVFLNFWLPEYGRDIKTLESASPWTKVPSGEVCWRTIYGNFELFFYNEIVCLRTGFRDFVLIFFCHVGGRGSGFGNFALTCISDLSYWISTLLSPSFIYYSKCYCSSVTPRNVGLRRRNEFQDSGPPEEKASWKLPTSSYAIIVPIFIFLRSLRKEALFSCFTSIFFC